MTSFLHVLTLVVASTAATALTAAPSTTVAAAYVDLNGDGRVDSLELVWVGGSNCVDDVEWCGQGPKYMGSFVFRVTFAGEEPVDTSFTTLHFEPGFLPDSLGTPWGLVVTDYNADGQPDFNVGAYSGCLGLTYSFFTVRPTGQVEVLPFEERANPRYVERPEGGWSTTRFKPTKSGFQYTFFGLHEDLLYDRQYSWDRFNERFSVIEHTRPARAGSE